MAGEGRAPGGGGPARWEIEVHLARGTVLRREARGEGARQAIEAVLARCDFRPAQVSGIAAYPRLDGRGA